MPTRIIHVGSGKDVAKALAPAVKALREGKLVAFPTETVYGIGAVAGNEQAFDRLREVKDRPDHPFTLHIGRPDDAQRYVKDIPPAARQLMAKGWPGPLTLLLPTGGRFADPELADKALHKRICPAGLLGLRCPDHPAAQELLEKVRQPVVASSANRAGRAPPNNAQDVLEQLQGVVDVLIDAGPTRYRKASTIVSFEHGRCEIVRAGVYDERMIRSMALRRILFVCTGNTCRSPLAAAIAAKQLAGRLHCRAEELPKHGLEVLSAGTLGVEGLPAAADAVGVARKLGLSLAHHRSRKLSNELIHSADLIFCMSGHHVREVTRMSPGAAGRTLLLDADGDIADPIGGGEHAYQDVAGRIQSCLRNRMKEILP